MESKPPMLFVFLCQKKARMSSRLLLNNEADWKKSRENIRRRISRLSAPKSFFFLPKIWRTRISLDAWIYHVKLSQSGESAFSMSVCMVFKIDHVAAGRVIFPPDADAIMEVKALACDPPKERRKVGFHSLVLAIMIYDIAHEAVRRGIVASITISGATVYCLAVAECGCDQPLVTGLIGVGFGLVIRTSPKEQGERGVCLIPTRGSGLSCCMLHVV